MTEERFAALAEAYGGEIGRWPEAERFAASTFAAAHPLDAQRLLTPERQLDRVLEAAPLAAPSAALRQAVIAAGPLARAAGQAWRWITGVGLGLGLSAACAAGVVVGLTETPPSVVRAITGQRAAEPADDTTALIVPDADRDEG